MVLALGGDEVTFGTLYQELDIFSHCLVATTRTVLFPKLSGNDHGFMRYGENSIVLAGFSLVLLSS